METWINIQEVEVQRIRIDYIQPHKRVYLHIEYCNAIPTTSRHKIYYKSISLESYNILSYCLYIFLS